jgi:hypothetical protein
MVLFSSRKYKSYCSKIDRLHYDVTVALYTSQEEERFLEEKNALPPGGNAKKC